MAAVDKLLKLLKQKNIADMLEEEEKKQIIDDAIRGYEIDDDSRQIWLEANQKAMEIIKHCEEREGEKDFPFPKSSKVIYPLLAPAVIHLASRMCQAIQRNDKVLECTIIGDNDPLEVAPGMNIYPKQIKCDRIEKFLNYEFLLESDTWLKDTHKLCHIVASWGTGFRQVYYDPITQRNASDVLNPEDVIINHNISCLEKARRITIKHHLTKNDILSNIRAGYFSDDFQLELLDREPDEYGEADVNPSFEIKCQQAYLDLDEDGYAEPYKIYFYEEQRWLLGIYPAFDFEDISFNEKGQVKQIKAKIDIIDYHCIDSPDGKFYSLGLNYLLLHQNKSIDSILRQLIDSGTLANTQGGFITSVFKTKEKKLRYKMGEFTQLDVNPNINPQQHILPLPFKEPSTVLLSLLQVLIQSGEKVGFITDVLTGDMAAQNVPATTMLAMIEQGTRAFKPIIQKLYISLKKEFKLWFNLHQKYMNAPRYIQFAGGAEQVLQSDFDSKSVDVMPVADPTVGTDSQKYAKAQFLFQLLSTQVVGATNVQEILYRIFKDLDYKDPEKLIAPPPDPSQNPEVIQMQLQAQKNAHKAKMDEVKAQINIKDSSLRELNAKLNALQTQLNHEKDQATFAENQQKIDIERKKTIISAYEAETNRKKTEKETQKKSDE